MDGGAVHRVPAAGLGRGVGRGGVRRGAVQCGAGSAAVRCGGGGVGWGWGRGRVRVRARALRVRCGVVGAGPNNFQVMFEYFLRSEDCFSWKIDALHVLPNAKRVDSCTTVAARCGSATDRHAARSGQQVPYSLRHPCSFPIEDQFAVADDGALEEWVRGKLPPSDDPVDGRDIMMIQVPAPVVQLVVRGGWKTLMAMGRWFTHTRFSMKHSLLAPLHWLPDSLWTTMSTRSAPRPESCNFSAGDLRRLAEGLRRIAVGAKKLSDCRDDDGEIDDTMDTLAAAVSAFDGISLSIECDQNMLRDHWRKVPAFEALNGFIAAWQLRDKQHGLPKVLRHGIAACWPGTVGAALLQALDSASVRVPSKSTLQRWTLTFDLASMRAHSYKMHSHLLEGISTFWGADSSPQHGQDWMLAAYSWARSRDLPEIRQAAIELQCIPAVNLQDRRRLVGPLWKLHLHRLPAMAMGITTLAKKVEVVLHGCHLESEPEDLQLLLDSAVSGTFDMGTELGMTDFMASGGAGSVLPQHYTADDLDPDRPSIQASHPAETSVYLYKHSTTIPGLLHILHNTEGDLHKAMPFWKEFNLQAKQVLKLFSHPARHRRFMATCVEGRWAALKPQLDISIAKILESRWSTLVHAMRKLVPLEFALTTVWSPAQWKRAGAARGDDAQQDDEEDESEKFDCEMVTSCIRSPAFWAFAESLLKLQDALENFREWAEGCPCHRHAFEKMTETQRRNLLRKECGLRTADTLAEFRRGCPLAGRNAPDLALGQHKELLKSMAESGLALLLAKRERFLQAADVARINDNYMKGAERAQLYLLLKSSVWDSLPLSLAGLAHADTNLARAHCKKIMEEYDGQAAPVAETCSHWLTLRLLHRDHGLRAPLERWANGLLSDADLPTELKVIFAQMYLWPVVERWLERPHSQMKKIGAYKNVGGAYCSLAVRFPQQMAEVAEDPEYLRRLAGHFEETGTAFRAIKSLNLTGHPRLAPILDELQGKDLASSTRRRLHQHLRSELIHAVYLTSGNLQYIPAAAAASAHKRLRNQEEKEAGKVLPVLPGGDARGFQGMRQVLFRHHLVDLGFEWFSLPNCLLQESGLLPLQDMLAPHTTTLSDHGDLDVGVGAPCGTTTLATFELDGEEHVHVGELSFKQTVFRVVDWKPSRVKMVRMRGGALRLLNKNSLAISLHDAAPVEVGRPDLLVDSVAKRADHSSVSPIMCVQNIQKHLGDDAFEKYFLGWRQRCPGGSATFAFHGLMHDAECRAAIAVLIKADAWSEQTAFLPPIHEGLEAPLHKLSLLGLTAEIVEEAEVFQRRYYITTMGASRVVCGNTLSQPTRMAKVREGIPIADANPFELVERLSDRGYTWKSMPAAKSRARKAGLLCDLKMPAMQKKVWYGTPRVHYLRALLEPQAVMDAAKIDTMPHDRANGFYQKLWDGIVMPIPVPLDLPLECGPAAAAAGAAAIGDQEDRDRDLAAPEPGIPDARGDGMPDDSDAVSDDDDIMAELERVLFGGDGGGRESDDGDDGPAEIAAAEPEPEHSAEEMPPPLPPPLQPPPAPPAQAPKAAPMPPSPGPASSRPPPSPASAAKAIAKPGAQRARASSKPSTSKHHVHEDSHAWADGRFHFTYRPTTGPSGSWQCLCRFHKKNATTACTRSMSCRDGTEDEKQRILRCLKAWAVIAPSYTRKRTHARSPFIDDLPQVCIDLEMDQLPGLPAELLDDDQLNAAAARAATAAAAVAPLAAAAKAKAQAKKPAAKAKPKAKSSSRSSGSSSSGGSSSTSSSSSGASSS